MSASEKLPVRITPMVESRFGLDGGAMFGIIPRPLWSRTNPPDEQNRIDMTSRCLLIEYADGTSVLVDVSMGDRWTDKERGIYNVHAQDIGLKHALSTHALDPDSQQAHQVAEITANPKRVSIKTTRHERNRTPPQAIDLDKRESGVSRSRSPTPLSSKETRAATADADMPPAPCRIFFSS